VEDYDVDVGRHFVQGVDVWLNNPRRPLEASGTSGQKVVLNGGLNLSVLDGWWAEAFTPLVGWAIGDGASHDDVNADAVDADHLYRLLETEIVPEFYARDASGIPVQWLQRIRASMSELAPRFSTNRMVREYVDTVYTPAAARVRARMDHGAALARELATWSATVDREWSHVRFGMLEVRAAQDGYFFSVPVDVGQLDWCSVRVELFAEPIGNAPALRVPMQRAADTSGESGVHTAFVATTRPASHFTPRVIAHHEQACVPAESAQIHWYR
jgi:starch phosphorylase